MGKLLVTSLLHNHLLKLNAVEVQFFVALTALLMVIRFGLDALRHRSTTLAVALIPLDVAAYSLLQFTLGVMHLPSLKNSYYQVWAVLLVTLRYSVKHGRPAGIALRQTPLVDLMSSFWAANILRSNAVLKLKAPVWLLWSINSARIIHGFVSSEQATASHKENARLVAEYMRREHQLSATYDPATMEGYRYLVMLGEDKQEKEVRPPQYRLELKLTRVEELVTLDRIREWERGHGDGDGGNRSSAHQKRVSELLKYRNGTLRDLCLSFALYKLLRRRFYNLPIYESQLEKTKKLIFDGILGGAGHAQPANPESGAAAAASTDSASSGEAARHRRVFRIIKAELSFLNDFFHSRHALIFANGFPFLRLFLSSLLVGAIAYMAVAINQYSKVAKLDELGRVRHGVIFTWILLSLLGVKEIIEIAGYVFSDWTKVLLVCHYAREPWWLRGPVMETVVKLLCRYSFVRRWHGRIGQHNIVFGIGGRLLTALPEEVQKAVLPPLRRLGDSDSSHESYLDRALSTLPEANKRQLRLPEKVHAEARDFEGDVHRTLLWHIATCYCELHLADAENNGARCPWWARPFACRSTWVSTGPLVKKSDPGEIGEHRVAAVRLSQYCAYVLRLNPPLMPGNEIITRGVVKQVTKQTRRALRGCYSKSATFAKLKEMARRPNGEGASPGNKEVGAAKNQGQGATECQSDEDTLLKMGSQLGQDLIEATGGDEALIWKFLAELWAGLVLHLARSTRASHHKLYLSTGGELMTHLWTLLSHAGLTGGVEHGEMGRSATPLGEDQQETVD